MQSVRVFDDFIWRVLITVFCRAHTHTHSLPSSLSKPKVCYLLLGEQQCSYSPGIVVDEAGMIVTTITKFHFAKLLALRCVRASLWRCWLAFPASRLQCDVPVVSSGRAVTQEMRIVLRSRARVTSSALQFQFHATGRWARANSTGRATSISTSHSQRFVPRTR